MIQSKMGASLRVTFVTRLMTVATTVMKMAVQTVHQTANETSLLAWGEFSKIQFYVLRASTWIMFAMVTTTAATTLMNLVVQTLLNPTIPISIVHPSANEVSFNARLGSDLNGKSQKTGHASKKNMFAMVTMTAS